MPSLVSITMDQMTEDSNRRGLCHLTILRTGGERLKVSRIGTIGEG